MMLLTDVIPSQSYRILHLAVAEDSVLGARLRQLGFVDGMEFDCQAVAPLVKSPYLVRIRGLSIALARHEAELIKVEKLSK